MSDVAFLLVLAAPLVAIWLLLIRPAQRRNQEAAALAASVQVGQEVVTTSGLYGLITRLDDSTVWLQVASGVELRFDRRAVGRALASGSDEAPGSDEEGVDPSGPGAGS